MRQSEISRVLVRIIAGLLLGSALVHHCGAAAAQTGEGKTMDKKMIGMYVHQHWSYKHPYSARTWTLEDWDGYLDGLHRMGFNTVLIWPMLETMPDPLTESDQRNLEKIARVIDLAHESYGMQVHIVLCPNVSAKNEEAAKYTVQERPFFHTDTRIDPADPAALSALLAWRERLLRPLAKVDGLFIIDSDPGGWPNSTNLEFVYLLNAHRAMLDRLRPGIAIYYWLHFGWEAYGRFYATADLVPGPIEEIQDAIALLAKQAPEPWGLASGQGADVADPLGLGDRVLTFNYGAIEGEPSFPMTRFGGDSAYEGGKRSGRRGVMGNSQTHCVQLPNAFAFSRGAQGLPLSESDYAAFAEDLLPGHGGAIVAGWKALNGSAPATMEEAAAALEGVKELKPVPGPLKGLLFGDGSRFLDDLVLQLKASAALMRFHAAAFDEPGDPQRVRETFAAFVDGIAAWQEKHDYKNHWYWHPMNEALRELEMPVLNETLDTLTWASEEGETGFERVKKGLARLETYTPRLIEAMRKALDEMQRGETGR